MTKIFISGPMTGIENYNANAFIDAEEQLLAAGWDVVNPYYNQVEKDAPREEHMRADLKLLLECDTIYSLIGWHKSVGATVEFLAAKQCGMKQILQTQFGDVPTPTNFKETKNLWHSITHEQLTKSKEK